MKHDKKFHSFFLPPQKNLIEIFPLLEISFSIPPAFLAFHLKKKKKFDINETRTILAVVKERKKKMRKSVNRWTPSNEDTRMSAVLLPYTHHPSR